MVCIITLFKQVKLINCNNKYNIIFECNFKLRNIWFQNSNQELVVAQDDDSNSLETTVITDDFEE